jgi:hypothetical protein
VSLKARVITVQNLARELKQLAEELPDFKKQMINLSDELIGIYNGIDSIQESFENLLKKQLSEEKEADLAELENRINELYIQLLGKKLDFQGLWKPSFRMHTNYSGFASFIERYDKILDNTIKIAEGLRVSLSSRSEWVRSQRNSRIEQRLKYLTVFLTFTVFGEVFIGLAQIYQQWQLFFAFLAIITPPSIAIIYLLLVPKSKS